MSDKTYAQFNTLTITGRVSHTEVVEKDGDKWVSVTLLTELKDDATAVAVTFNSSNGILRQVETGWFPNGRRVTVTGHLDSVSEISFDQKAGKARRLQRPRLHLTGVQVLPGGFGPKKADSKPEMAGDIEIVDAPAIPSKGDSIYGETTDLARL